MSVMVCSSLARSCNFQSMHTLRKQTEKSELHSNAEKHRCVGTVRVQWKGHAANMSPGLPRGCNFQCMHTLRKHVGASKRSLGLEVLFADGRKGFSVVASRGLIMLAGWLTSQTS